ncbi:hypothetical protein NCCP2716_13840 [Sporosarcina sp. NCCP-2716]|uniref:hypothetical protein n=1 Tax=Sporosarcina sp. NCCP-2716 TaxID=2943679 RepID=UPI0020410FE6|nr:hypothetical protein [Sporosarcina sp. NCCP-2716]GKV68886.1 hypothetical protein NCCP2716_13840 [Sporosarcina sp. NCCP-2716]
MNAKDLLTKLDFAVIISLLVGMSYCLTFIYFKGKFSFYDIPSEFVEVNIKDIFYTMVLVIPSIFNLVFGLVAELKSHFKFKNESLNYISYKKINTEIKSSSKNLNMIEKELRDNDDNSLKLEIELQEQLEELLVIEKDIQEFDPRNGVESQNLKERVNDMKRRIENNISELANATKEREISKSFIQENKRRIKRVKKKVLKDIIYIIIFFALLLVVISIVGSILFSRGQTIYIYLFVIPIILIVINKWLIKREKFILVSIGMILASILVAYVIGYNTSKIQEKYIIIEKEKNLFVAVGVYNDTFLCKKINEEEMTFGNDTTLISISEVENFVVQDIGVLKKNTKYIVQ